MYHVRNPDVDRIVKEVYNDPKNHHGAAKYIERAMLFIRELCVPWVTLPEQRIIEAFPANDVEGKLRMLSQVFSHLKHPVDTRRQFQENRDLRAWKNWCVPLAELNNIFNHERCAIVWNQEFRNGDCGKFKPTFMWRESRIWPYTGIGAGYREVNPLNNQHLDFWRRRHMR